MKKMVDSFTRRYGLSKTLRFRLIPQIIGDQEEQTAFLKTLLSEDEERARQYPKMKELLDELHKKHIAATLGAVELKAKWSELEAAIRNFRREKNLSAKNALGAKQGELRTAIATVAKWAKTDTEHAKLTASTPKDLLANLALSDLDDAGKKAVEAFKGFACYFIGFQDNRANIYSTEGQVTAIPNRLVNENFPKFMDNMDAYQVLRARAPQLLEEAEKELKETLGTKKLADYFQVEFYDHCLSQGGIDAYNLILGGRSLEAGQKKVRGLNEFVNLYCQQHPEEKDLRKKGRFSLLYKLILSDRVSASFIPDAFANDTELRAAVNEYRTALASLQQSGQTVHVLDELQSIFDGLARGEFDKRRIWIGSQKLSALSHAAFGDWSLLGRAFETYATATFSKKKDREAFGKQGEYSLEDIEKVLAFVRDREKWEELEGKGLETFFEELVGPKGVIAVVREKDTTAAQALQGDSVLRDSKEDAKALKEYLDAVMECLHACEMFCADSDAERDASFYDRFDAGMEALHPVIPLYNTVRNYMSQRPADVAKKFKLMFQNPTLAAGWDQNKERDNTAILLMRDGKYYLGVMNAKSKPNITPEEDAGPHPYRKMVYKLLPGPNKMLPKVFFSRKWMDRHDVPSRILEIREKGSYKKGPTYSERDSIDFIDYYKACIAEYSDWNVFHFKFSPTESYDDINDFFNEVSQQGFSISFDDVSEEQIHRLVREKKLMLFQIYSKDFSEKSHGKPNLHTLYWKALFDPDNLKDLVAKLNGEAELFYRPAVVKKAIVHEAGSQLVDRRTIDGAVIPDAIHQRIYKNANGELADRELTEEEREWKGRARIHEARYAITKDRRYTENQYQFHVPIKLNACCFENFKPSDFNAEVRKTALADDDLHIIGLDRGERNLVYLSLIDREGNICLQRSFNVLNGMDYQARLKDREDERQEARKSWKGVGTIKELKEGYLSQVVHEIAELMVKHNAIVALEDLNFGFKRVRFGVERQVYQKFEKALIDKLNYLAFKDRGPREAGGILNALQLTAPFQSFEKLGKQSGFLFYVPAAYTSKIDPLTGFANLLDLRYTNMANAKELLARFTGIRFNPGAKHFEFQLDYDQFRTRFPDGRKKWTVCTHGDRRYSYNPAEKKTETVNVTKRMQELFTTHGIAWQDGTDLKAAIAKVEDAGFFKGLFRLLNLTMAMRYSKDEEDFILSPVQSKDGQFFDSREGLEGLPKDADANGAYHIALKALCLLKRAGFVETGDLKLSNEDWLAFAQERRQ